MSAVVDINGSAFREPPHNSEAELAFLGALFADNTILSKVPFLKAGHFYIHGDVFAACLEVIERGQVADPITLSGKFDGDRLAQVAMSTVSLINATEYARLIHECWLAKRRVEIGESIAAAAFNLEDTAALEAELSELHSSTGGAKHIHEFAEEYLRHAEDAAKATTRIGMGLTDLDRLLDGRITLCAGA